MDVGTGVVATALVRARGAAVVGLLVLLASCGAGGSRDDGADGHQVAAGEVASGSPERDSDADSDADTESGTVAEADPDAGARALEDMMSRLRTAGTVAFAEESDDQLFWTGTVVHRHAIEGAYDIEAGRWKAEESATDRKGEWYGREIVVKGRTVYTREGVGHTALPWHRFPDGIGVADLPLRASLADGSLPPVLAMLERADIDTVLEIPRGRALLGTVPVAAALHVLAVRADLVRAGIRGIVAGTVPVHISLDKSGLPEHVDLDFAEALLDEPASVPKRMRTKLPEANYTASLERYGEVVKVKIPAKSVLPPGAPGRKA